MTGVVARSSCVEGAIEEREDVSISPGAAFVTRHVDAPKDDERLWRSLA